MRRAKSGFTLMELTIAMTITVITSLAVAGATVAISKAHAGSEDFYQSLQTGRYSMFKIQSTVQKAKLITFCSPSSILLWLDDTNNDGTGNMDELGFITHAANEVRFYRLAFPANMVALNTTVPLSQAVSSTSLISQITASAYAPPTVLATDVTSVNFSATPSPPMATLVKITLTVGTGNEAMTLRSAAATRAGATGKVGISDGQYVLTP